ncbi:MAG: transporter substrate-binding domain-containing protein [Clostridia bacterium]|nr:transporter substrate-binding domain-containing protein [Clostridia bacterium]
MKKILALVLAALMMLSATLVFASCDTPSTTDNKGAAPSASEESASDEADGTDGEKQVLKMATNAYFPPYEYYEGDKIVGIDAEIAAAIAEKLGMELVIEDMAFDSILTAVENGSVDFGMAGMTVNPDRLKSVNFTISYAKGVQVVIVKEDSPITTVDDLFADGATYKVGVQTGTTGDSYSSSDFGDARVSRYVSGNEAVAALLRGDVDCVIIDNQPAKSYVANNEGTKILATSYADEDYAICVSKTNEALLEKLDTAIYALIEDGTIAGIVAKYIKE